MKNTTYIFLVCLFCNIFVTGNLIFGKFTSLKILNLNLDVSVGILLFPITFLISDLVTEFYGKAKAFLMINVSIVITLLTVVVIYIADSMKAASWSTVSNETFRVVFGSFGPAVFSSLVANYISQNCDIIIYDYIKHLTKGRHLWLRNNLSTFIAQIIDTFCVATIMLVFGKIPNSKYFAIALSSLQFKIIATILSTPFCYIGYRIIKIMK
jgi:uncharacterized integral membrane protein (TIGR00697 family)